MRITGLIVGSGGFSAPHGFRPLAGSAETPFGPAAHGCFRGDLAGAPVVILQRHGAPRSKAPHAINYRANLWRLKNLGVERIIATYAVGGIDPALQPGALAIASQIIDYTWGRAHTFDDSGATHVDFTEPFDADLSRRLRLAAQRIGVELVAGGLYGCTQGPRLESAAEIDRLERDGCRLVGMTAMPEAALARELKLPLAGICLVVNEAAGRGPDPGRIAMDALQRHAQAAYADIMRLLREFLRDAV